MVERPRPEIDILQFRFFPLSQENVSLAALWHRHVCKENSLITSQLDLIPGPRFLCPALMPNSDVIQHCILAVDRVCREMACT